MSIASVVHAGGGLTRAYTTLTVRLWTPRARYTPPQIGDIAVVHFRRPPFSDRDLPLINAAAGWTSERHHTFWHVLVTRDYDHMFTMNEAVPVEWNVYLLRQEAQS